MKRKDISIGELQHRIGKGRIPKEKECNVSDYTHKVDKSGIPTCKILGVDIAAIDMQWLLEFTKNHVKELSGDYICVTNVHTIVTAFEDEKFKDVQNNGILAIPDGGPLSSIGRKRGYLHMQRTTGPSYMEEILRMSSQYGWTHYFYGSTKETLGKLKERIEKDFQDTQIVGMYSPPFRTMTKIEDEDIVKEINDMSPDFLWIGLGAPKQERWMAEHRNIVHGLMVGVGAAFDYYAGNINRAPQWMQKANLEWLYRLVQDPKRLFKRYFVTNSKFIWHVVIRGR